MLEQAIGKVTGTFVLRRDQVTIGQVHLEWGTQPDGMPYFDSKAVYGEDFTHFFVMHPQDAIPLVIVTDSSGFQANFQVNTTNGEIKNTATGEIIVHAKIPGEFDRPPFTTSPSPSNDGQEYVSAAGRLARELNPVHQQLLEFGRNFATLQESQGDKKCTKARQRDWTAAIAVTVAAGLAAASGFATGGIGFGVAAGLMASAGAVGGTSAAKAEEDYKKCKEEAEKKPVN